MIMTDQRLQPVVAKEALDWFVLNRGGVLMPAERAAFGAWLKSSPLHVEEYLRIAVMSQNLHAAIDTLSIDTDALLAEARAEDHRDVIALWGRAGGAARGSRSRRLLISRLAIAAAVGIIALAGVAWMERDGQRFGLPREFETAHGEERSWLLPDGSGLDLNSDSEVIVHYNKHERVAEIDRGQALFRVAHERARRFRVVAGKTAVIAVGTAFDVLRESSATVVTVVQGKVAVFTGPTPPPAPQAALPAHALSVSAGEQVRISDRPSKVVPSIVTKANVEQVVGWAQHDIVFDRQPLGEVAAEFSRYSSVPIVIQSTKLRAVPISGVLNEYDTESFLAFIARLDGAEIERLGDRILVVDKSK